MIAAMGPRLIAVLAAVLVVIGASSEPAFADPPAPVASYSFDGGAARDSGGDHLDGIVRGASFTERGKFGDALNFDGTNDTVTIPDSFILDFEEGFTLEAWVRADTLGTYASILMRESSQANFGYALYGNDNGGPSGYTSDELANVSSIRGASAIPTDEWSHLALTYDGDDLKLYVNGDLVDSTSSVVAPQDSDGDLEIGGNAIWGEYFDGIIDEVRLYNVALDDTEIEDDMTTAIEPAQRPDPVAAYAFNDGSARDTTLQHDAIVDGPSFTANGKFGGGLDFDGTDDKVSIPDDGSLDLQSGFTLEAWVHPDSLGTYASVFMKESSQANFSYALYGADNGAPSGYLQDNQSNSSNVYGSSPIGEDEWTHLAMSYDGTLLKLYADGELIDSTVSAVAPHDSDGDLQIGGNTIWGEYFDGVIDEVRVYGEDLGQGEIQEDMATEVDPAPRPDPVAEYSFDGGEALDSAGENDGTVDGATLTPGGMYGDALNFDGVDDMVSIPDSPDFDFSRGFTAEVWVRPESLSGWNSVITESNSDPGDPFGFVLYANDASDVPRAELAGGDETYAAVAGSEQLPLNQWSHLAVVSDTRRLTLFVDGDAVDSAPAPQALSADSPVEIGANSRWGENFDGDIDEPTLTNAPRSAKEIDDDKDRPISPSFDEQDGPFVFSAARTNGDSTAFSKESASTAPTALKTDATDAAISPNGETVAYVHTGSGGEIALVTEAFDGGSESTIHSWEPLPPLPLSLDVSDPAFNPAGDHVAVECQPDAIAARSQKRLVEAAATSACEGDVEIYDVDDGDQAAFGGPPDAGSPNYSLDGGRLLVDESDGNGGSSIRDVRTDGSDNELFFDSYLYASDPALSPDGMSVAFTGKLTTNSVKQIYELDLATGKARQLTTNGGQHPAWTPSGDAITYIYHRDAMQINVSNQHERTIINAPFTVGGTRYAEVTSFAYPRPPTVDAMARRLRPNLLFDTAERFRPMNVEAFFRERQSSIFLDPDPLHGVCSPEDDCEPILSSAGLIGHPEPGSYINVGTIYAGPFEDDYYGSPTCTESEEIKDCEIAPTSAIYYHTSEDETYTYLDYWMFYRYNDFPGGPVFGGDHEGDWESVTLAVSGGLEADSFDYASFSQHGTWVRYLEENTSCSEGEARIACGNGDGWLSVYPANGSHANYPFSCHAASSSTPDCDRGHDLVLPEAGYDGERPWAENDAGSPSALLRMPEPASDPDNSWDTGEPKVWTDWPGEWGPDGPASPASSSNGDHFYDPGSYVCAYFNGDCDASARGTTAYIGESEGVPERCAAWFGAGVNVALCDPEQVSEAMRQGRIDDKGRVSAAVDVPRATEPATAPGLSQQLGPALKRGDVVALSGPVRPGAILLLKVQLKKALFVIAVNDLRPADRALEVQAQRGQPRLLSADGSRQVPFRVLAASRAKE